MKSEVTISVFTDTDISYAFNPLKPYSIHNMLLNHLFEGALYGIMVNKSESFFRIKFPFVNPLDTIIALSVLGNLSNANCNVITETAVFPFSKDRVIPLPLGDVSDYVDVFDNLLSRIDVVNRLVPDLNFQFPNSLQKWLSKDTDYFIFVICKSNTFKFSKFIKYLRNLNIPCCFVYLETAVKAYDLYKMYSAYVRCILTDNEYAKDCKSNLIGKAYKYLNIDFTVPRNKIKFPVTKQQFDLFTEFLACAEADYISKFSF